jgi:hypothetical protein
MELYILDESLKRTAILSSFTTMIWTEKYSDIGDFEMTLAPENSPEELKVGTFLYLDASDRVMRVKNITKETDENGGQTVKVLGEGLEAVLKDRANQPAVMTYYTPPAFTGGPPAQTLVLTDKPADIIRTLFNDICRNNTINVEDNIPGINPGGDVTWSGMMAEPDDIVEHRVELEDLFTTIKNIADIYMLGFGIFRTDEDGTLYFGVWPGRDCTSLQSDRDPIIFGENFVELTKGLELTSSENYKNVAYVFAKNGSYMVFESTYAEMQEGLDRRVLIVNATDIELAAGVDLDAALLQRGKEELAKHNILYGFDGQLPTETGYVYKTDYFLGDLVEQRGTNGVINFLRVSEQIFTIDENGESSYPTFTVYLSLTAEEWLAIPAVKVWDDYVDEVWDDV